MEVNMYKSDQARKPDDLDRRYREIGISAVTAALHYRSGMKSAAELSDSKEQRTDAIQKSNRLGNGGQMRHSRAGS